MAQAGTEAGCTVCEDMKNKQEHCKTIVLKEDLLSVPEAVAKKKRKVIRDRKADEFLKYINAFLNFGGGIICLHVDDLHKLGMFEQSVNERMADLLPDDRPFHESFDRTIVGKNHVIFRVVPGEGHLSTFCFNTKIPFDCRVENPTHGQMRHLMTCTKGEDRGDPDQCQDSVLTFSKDNTVKVVKKPGEIGEESVFQESRSIQAKSVPPIRTTFLDALGDFFKKDKTGTYLPKYISAFTKLPNGGSIFLGIKEDKVEILKWTKVEEGKKNELLTLHNGNFDLWTDKDGQYLVAEGSPVEKGAQESGQFMCKGIKINEEERNTLPGRIRQLIEENTYWCSDDQQQEEHQVEVVFREVEGTDSDEELFVVEIKVHRYHRMVFHDKDGPVAYTFPTMDGKLPEKVTKEDWLERMRDQ